MAKGKIAPISLLTPPASVDDHILERINRIVDWLHAIHSPASGLSFSPQQDKKRRRVSASSHGSLISYKRHRLEGPYDTTISVPIATEGHRPEDVDLTPRPSRFSSQSLAAPLIWPHTSLSLSSTGSSSRDLSSYHSKSPRRRPSPEKSASLQFMTDPIAVRQIDFRNLNNLPDDAQFMLRTIRRYAKGNGVITTLQKLLSLSRDPDLIEDLAYMIDDTKRAKIGNAPMPSTLADLLCKAQQAQDEGQSEFAWNMSVHYPLLNMAVETSSYKGSFALRAATHARITPETLLPMDIDNTRPDGHMIDLVVALDLPSSIVDIVRTSHSPGRTTSFNQTEYLPLRYRPLSISVETKLPGDDSDKGQTQLGVWVRAQYTKLEQLLRLATTFGSSEADAKTIPLPVFPLLLVQGHEWNLMVAFREGDTTVLLSKILFGTTASYEGIYRIVAVVHFLLQWAKTSLSPWWYTNILTPLYGAVA